MTMLQKTKLILYNLSLEVYRIRIGSVYPLKKILNSINYFFKKKEVVIEGNKMFLDHEDMLKLSLFRMFEPTETELIKKYVKKGDTVLDIGANIGYFTLNFAKLVGKEGKVFAFEPNPQSFSLLKKNVEANGYHNVTLIPKAISSETGKARLYLVKYKNLPLDSITWDPDDKTPSIEVDTTRLDDYFKGYTGKINFIKIDVDGPEAHIMQGGNIFKKNDNIKILIELYPFTNEGYGISSNVYLNFLVEHNFILYDIEKNGTLKQVTVSELLEKYTPQKKNFTNLLCIKNKNSVKQVKHFD